MQDRPFGHKTGEQDYGPLRQGRRRGKGRRSADLFRVGSTGGVRSLDGAERVCRAPIL